jgi:hypothetical protein
MRATRADARALPRQRPDAGEALSVGLLYQHCRELDHVRYDVGLGYRYTHAHAEPDCARSGGGCDFTERWHHAFYFEAAYRWLAERVGFWPLWLAVGGSDDDRRRTSYHDQFRRAWADGVGVANPVLFSWREKPSPLLRYPCFEHWSTISLTGIDCQPPQASGPRQHRSVCPPADPRAQTWILHPSWSEGDWLRRAGLVPRSVQAVAPMLDLRSADAVWCRNQPTRRRLVEIGFDPGRVQVRRLAVR